MIIFKSKLPDFIIIGAQKCGTTTLHFALAKHPSIFMSDPKELNFFQDDQNNKRGIDWYASFFTDCPVEQIAGESSPEYLHYDYVAERIAKNLPSAKLIILLRNPVDRAYSAYWHAIRHGGETLPFERAIEVEDDRIKNDLHAKKFYSYLYRGYYAQQARKYFEYFQRSQIFIIIAEEYFSNPESILTQVTNFLGVNCDQDFLQNAGGVLQNKGRAIKSKSLQRFYVFIKTRFPFLEERFPFCTQFFSKLNKKKAKYPPLSFETRRRLSAHFSYANSELQEMLGRDLSLWSYKI